MLHLKTRSFAAHLALNTLYDSLVELADSLAEMSQGKYGVLDIPAPDMNAFDSTDAKRFIGQLATWVDSAEDIPNDSFIQNEWDNVKAIVYKTKYKLENLI